ncbi:MAG: CotH kinase family protein [Lachnospiraceae bacterium]|nr:CotH kinase family protein [Lachnospiraceae bacterium]
MTNDIFKDRFLNRMLDLMESNYSSDNITAAINALETIMNPIMPLQRARWSAPAWTGTWESQVARFKAEVAARPDALTAQKHAYFSEHSYTVFVSTTATCEKNGLDTFECSTGGCTATTTVSRNALGHDLPEDWTERTAADCENDGLEYKACRRGGCSHEETRGIEALGHSFTNYTGDIANCSTETATCDRSGCTETDERATSALGHTPKAANCTECSVCGETGLARTCTTSNPCTFHAGTPNNDPATTPSTDPTTGGSTDSGTGESIGSGTDNSTDPTTGGTGESTDSGTDNSTDPTTGGTGESTDNSTDSGTGRRNPYTAVTISFIAAMLAGGAVFFTRKIIKRKEKITD